MGVDMSLLHVPAYERVLPRYLKVVDNFQIYTILIVISVVYYSGIGWVSIYVMSLISSVLNLSEAPLAYLSFLIEAFLIASCLVVFESNTSYSFLVDQMFDDLTIFLVLAV